VVALAVQRRPEASTVVRLEDRRARRRWRRGGARGWWRSAREKEDALWSFLEEKKTDKLRAFNGSVLDSNSR
jgi:hypothetical protein